MLQSIKINRFRLSIANGFAKEEKWFSYLKYAEKAKTQTTLNIGLEFSKLLQRTVFPVSHGISLPNTTIFRSYGYPNFFFRIWVVVFVFFTQYFEMWSMLQTIPRTW